MKLARLLLQAFGPFTDVEIDFTNPDTEKAANLHVIFGPNEAGKSCALRAMTDLRFGIPVRSTDGFLHPTQELAIAGIFVNGASEPISLVRCKKRNVSLFWFDPITRAPIPSPEVGQEYKAALTGGLTREEFEAMYGLDHERLREGGRHLLEGQGELGMALFEASAGTRGVAAVIAALEEGAKTLFNPHGQAQKATINKARADLETHRRLWKQAQIRPTDWLERVRTHADAQAKLEEIEHALEVARRELGQIQELRTVAPLLDELDRASAEIATLADVPDLSPTAKDERRAAEGDLRRAREEMETAAGDMGRCDDALARLVVEVPLIEHAEAIERLAGMVDEVGRARLSMRQDEAAIGLAQSELSIRASRIAPRQGIETVLAAVPSAADRVALDSHLTEHGRLFERLEGLRTQLEEHADTARRDASEGQLPMEPAAREALASALDGARALGDVARAVADLEDTLRTRRNQLRQALADLGVPSVETLRTARPLLDAEILEIHDVLTKLSNKARELRAEDGRLKSDLTGQQAERRKLESVGEVVTAETLQRARARRDDGWSRIRRAYIERNADSTELGRDFDPEHGLPEAFEAAQKDADQKADLLRADTERATAYEVCIGRLREMEARQAQITREQEIGAQDREQLLSDWSRRLQESGLPALEPNALREWQAARQAALESAEGLATEEARHARLGSNVEAAVWALSVALRSVGRQPPSDTLPSLVALATRLENEAAIADGKRIAHLTAEQARRVTTQRLEAQVDSTRNGLAHHETAIRMWHARLFLPPDSTPQAVKARLGELHDLARESQKIAETRGRLASAVALVDEFTNRARTLAPLVGGSLSKYSDPEDFANDLRKRLAAAHEREHERKTLVTEKVSAEKRRQGALATQIKQLATLDGLCSAAGVPSVDLLPGREEQAARKRELKGTVADLERLLSKASRETRDTLRTQLANRDHAALDGALERCNNNIEKLQQDLADAREAEERARSALAAIDSSDLAAREREHMEAALARYRGAIHPWARLKLARALLQQAVNRFRERAQAPMVATASRYFALMTNNRYPRLVTDETRENPTLLAMREDGKQIGVEAMSEGTRDQLFLALRLAALDLRNSSHPPMPLILDDVLVTSDDERAANVLRALALFASDHQVMLFTHHQHIVALARAGLGNNVVATHTLG
jgi:uncharacterized protein YhaN